MGSGIYAIVNKTNGNLYIGSAKNFKNRWYRHTQKLKNNIHHSRHLQFAWNKYGQESFDFVILEECSESALILREQHYIDSMNPEYNVCKTAGSRLGNYHTQESIKKMSESRKGKTATEETKKKMSSSRTGFKFSDESKAKMSASQMGKTHTLESRNKMSCSHTGVAFSIETRDRMSKAQTGRKQTDEAKAKVSLAQKGKKKSPEHIEKLRQSAKLRWEKKRLAISTEEW